MFDFIKRLFSKPDVPQLPQSTLEIAFRAGMMISMNLMAERCTPDIIARLSLPFSRGYLFGWLDAASQYANIELNDKEFLVFMVAGHFPIKDDIGDMTTFVMASSELQGTLDLENGRALGGQEYIASLEGKLSMPIGLINFLNR